MPQPFPAFGDNPITAVSDDWLGRKVHAEALAELIRRPRLDMPLTIGIYGDWGSGKTSLLRLIRGQFSQDDLVFWFNAWAYSRQPDALWRAMLLALVNALRRQKERLLDDGELKLHLDGKPASRAALEQDLEQRLERLETSLYRSQVYREREGYDINWQTAALLGVRATVRMIAPVLGEEAIKALMDRLADGEDVKDLFSVLKERTREELREHVRSLEQFRSEFAQLIRDYVNLPGRRLIGLIDDLDRCLPEAAIGVLEALKIFFDADDGEPLNLVFVLGMDRRIIERGIRAHYATFAPSDRLWLQPMDSGEYLDKIIQIPYSVPPLNTAQIRAYAQRWCGAYQEELAPAVSLIAIGVAPNPRSVKRTLHSLSLLLATRARMGQATDEETLKLLTKLVIIQMSYEALFREIARRPELLQELERASDAPAPTSVGLTAPPAGIWENLLSSTAGRAELLAQTPRLQTLLRASPRFPVEPDRTRALLESLLYFQA
jgi:hypothetical protein